MTTADRPTAVVFDLDGTLSSAVWREPFILDEHHPPDWNAYFQHLVHDAPVPAVVEELKRARAAGHAALLLTSRRDDLRDQTEFWLLANGIAHDGLFMRPFEDTRADTDVKHDVFRRSIEPGYDVVAAYDDQARILDMWRGLGVTAHAVTDPDLTPAIPRAVAQEWHRQPAPTVGIDR